MTLATRSPALSTGSAGNPQALPLTHHTAFGVGLSRHACNYRPAPGDGNRPGPEHKSEPESPDMHDSTPTRPEQLRAAARYLDHLADEDVADEDRELVENAVRRHLEAAGVLT